MKGNDIFSGIEDGRNETGSSTVKKETKNEDKKKFKKNDWSKNFSDVPKFSTTLAHTHTHLPSTHDRGAWVFTVQVYIAYNIVTKYLYSDTEICLAANSKLANYFTERKFQAYQLVFPTKPDRTNEVAFPFFLCYFSCSGTMKSACTFNI